MGVSRKSIHRGGSLTIGQLLERLRRVPSDFLVMEVVRLVLLGERELEKKEYVALMREMRRFSSQIYKQMVSAELSRHGTARFSGKTIVRWYDTISDMGAHSEVNSALVALKNHGVRVPLPTLAKWAQRALRERDYRSGGEMIIWNNLIGTKLLDEEDLWWASHYAAKREGDHGIVRLYLILLQHFFPDGVPTLKGREERLAEIVHSMHWRSEEDRDPFVTSLLLDMTKEHLSPESHQLFLEAFGKLRLGLIGRLTSRLGPLLQKG